MDKSTRIQPAPEQDNYGSPARQKFSVAAGEGGSAKIQSGHAQGVAGEHPQGVGAGGDLPCILDLSVIDSGYNVSILQQSQLEWLLFLARHFSDGFKEA